MKISIWSDADKLTAHLKAPDFFNVEQFPTSTFVATGLRKSEEGEKGTHQLTGNFTLHGVEKSIEFPVTVTQSDDKVDINADFFINRFDRFRNLLVRVTGGDEESQSSELLFDSRVNDRLDINAAFEQIA